MTKKIEDLDEKLMKQGFFKCEDGKLFTLQEFGEFLDTEDALLGERGYVISDLYLRVADQSHPLKYIVYLRTNYA